MLPHARWNEYMMAEQRIRRSDEQTGRLTDTVALSRLLQLKWFGFSRKYRLYYEILTQKDFISRCLLASFPAKAAITVVRGEKSYYLELKYIRKTPVFIHWVMDSLRVSEEIFNDNGIPAPPPPPLPQPHSLVF